jgi:hypothetical protein
MLVTPELLVIMERQETLVPEDVLALLETQVAVALLETQVAWVDVDYPDPLLAVALVALRDVEIPAPTFAVEHGQL